VILRTSPRRGAKLAVAPSHRAMHAAGAMFRSWAGRLLPIIMGQNRNRDGNVGVVVQPSSGCVTLARQSFVQLYLRPGLLKKSVGQRFIGPDHSRSGTILLLTHLAAPGSRSRPIATFDHAIASFPNHPPPFHPPPHATPQLLPPERSRNLNQSSVHALSTKS
jgi:hypothetical protein